jgi:membrane protein
MSGPSFQKTRELLHLVPFLEPIITSILPLLMICFTFAMFYKLVPNTKVDFGAAFIGGSLAGLAWHGYNNLGWLMASKALNANAAYGVLFIIPLLMGGLYMVWLTVLFGAQVAYAFQNRASYLQERLVENVNQRGREFVALRLMTCIGQRFHRGLPPATVREISVELGIPSKLVQQVMRTLLAAQLVVEVSGAEVGYSPARPLETINCHHILVAMRATHGQEPATRDEPVRIEVLGEFARIQAAEEQAAASVSMLTMVNRAQARLELAAPPEPGKPINVAADVMAVDVPMFVSAAVASTPTVSFSEPVAPTPSTTKPTPEQSEQVSTTEPKPVAAKPSNATTPAMPDDENRSFPL